MKGKSRNLTEGPVKKILFDLTIPMTFGMLGIVMFNVVDTYFVGKLGTNQLAALSFTFPVVVAIISLAHGVSVGASTLVSKAVGEGKIETVKNLAKHSLILGVVLVAIFVTLGLLTIDKLFSLLGADAHTIPYIKEYMKIWYIGIFFIVIPVIGDNIVRALGDTRTPALVMTVAGVTNIILDPIFIYGFGFIQPMGVTGAAIATVIARAITLVFSLTILVKREKLLQFDGLDFLEMFHSWKEILFIGLPDAFIRMMIPIGAGIITAIISNFGKEAVAAFGIGTRLDLFALLVMNSLSTIIIPFVGQNIGARKIKRAEEGIKLSIIFVIFYGLLISIMFYLASDFLASLFTTNLKVISFAKKYFWIVPLSYGANGILLIGGSTLMVLNKPLHSLALTALRLFVINIPIAYLSSSYFGINGIFFSIAISFIVMAIPTYYIVDKNLKEFKI